MKPFLLIVCLLVCKLSLSQHVEILNRSSFKHDLIVDNIEYLEDIKDTARLKYIATLKITEKTYYWPGIIAYWLNRFQTVSRELGADAFCLDSYSLLDSIGFLSIKVYFAGPKFMKLNKLKCDKNNLCFFGELTNLTKIDSFYVNKSIQYFDPRKQFLIKTKLNEEYRIAVNPIIAPQIFIFKKEKSSRYFIVPAKKTTTVTNKLNRNPMHKDPTKIIIYPSFGAASVITFAAVMVNIGRNTLIELKYRDGRLMSEIFK